MTAFTFVCLHKTTQPGHHQIELCVFRSIQLFRLKAQIFSAASPRRSTIITPNARFKLQTRYKTQIQVPVNAKSLYEDTPINFISKIYRNTYVQAFSRLEKNAYNSWKPSIFFKKQGKTLLFFSNPKNERESSYKWALLERDHSRSFFKLENFCKLIEKKDVIKHSFFSYNRLSDLWLSLNRSQHKRCSTEYNTKISNQVVCKKSYTPALFLSYKALSKYPKLIEYFGTYNGAILFP